MSLPNLLRAFGSLTLNYHVIYIHFHCTLNLISEHPYHHPLISGPCIFKSKGNHCVVIIVLWGYKGHFLLILGCQCDLVITLKCIQEAHPRVTICCIN